MKAICSFFICSLLLASGASAELLSQSYAVEKVREIHASHASKLEIRQGDSEILKVEGSAEALEHVRVNLENGVLRLENRQPAKGFWGWVGLNTTSDESVTFYIQVKDLEKLNLSGASNASLGAFTGRNLDLHLNGASHAKLGQLRLEQLELDLSGASRLTLESLQTRQVKGQISGASQFEVKASSQSPRLNVNLSGASKFHGRPLSVEKAKVEASGASYAEVQVSEQLDANASGASTIDYYGQPRIQQHSSGASSINHKGD
jgi:hypothetical protein